MEILFLTEGSPQLGHGHVMRSFYLAKIAQKKGFNIHFQAANQYTAEILYGLGETNILQSLPSKLKAFIIVIDMPTIIPMDIVHDLRARGAFIVMIDVLAEVRTEADIVCDAMMTQKRAKKLPHSNKAKYMYGLQYACIDEQFRHYHATPIHIDKQQPKLLVAFGGGDMFSSNIKFLSALARLNFRGPAEIIIGQEPNNNNIDKIHSIISDWQDSHIVCGARDMAKRMANADLVVTKLGLTQLEAFCVGRHCVVIEPTQAHLDLQRTLEEEYYDWPVCECGLAADDETFDIAARETINRLSDRKQRIEKGQRASQLVDGKGAERIIEAILQTINSRSEFQEGTR